MNGFHRTVGDELRRARRDAGLALRDVARRSAGEFKASAVGGYERGERAISLDRFFRLATLYGVGPDTLLGRVVERTSPGTPDAVIDLRGPGAEGGRPGASDGQAESGDRTKAPAAREPAQS